MRKFVITAVAVVAFIPMSVSAGDPKPKPPKDKDIKKLAAECVLQAVGSGAYTSMGYTELSEFCVELSKAVHSADYELPEVLGECP